MFPIFIFTSIFTLLLCQAQTQETCDNSLCNYEAICSLKNAAPICNCVDKFFKGDTCSEMIDHCNPNPCRNKGTCRPYLGHYFCECSGGFSGQTCTSKKDTFTGLHLHYNHIAPLGREQKFLLTVQNLGSVQTTMDFYTLNYVIDGGSFSSTTDHFKAHNRLSKLAKSLNLRQSQMMPYENGFYRISRGTFWKLGLRQMTLDLSDEETSESFFTEKFNIMIYNPTGQLCLPVIRMANCENPRQSLHIEIASFNFIEPVVQQRCKEHSDLRIKWSVRNYIDSVVLHTFPEDPSSTLTISPYTMWFDFRDDYLQSYLVQGDVSELDSGRDVIGRTVLRCYVFVDSKNTQAQIIGGPNREVNLGRSFVIDGSLSRDYARRPNGNQHLNYKWSCTSDDDSTNDHCLGDLGSGSRLFIPPRALNLDSTYKYKLEVQSTINIYSTSIAYQSIKPVTEDPLLLNFECLRNCQQLKFAAGKPIHLKVACLDCPAGEVTYSIRDGSGAEVSTSYRVITTEGTRAEISFEATATLGERKGTVSVKLKLNKPPANGKCVISPTSGVEYQTVFKITCSGYEDSQQISFVYKIGNSALDYGRNKELTTRLFPKSGATAEVRVSICDDLDACTEDQLQVSLSPISPTSSWLEFLKQSGSDLQKITADGDRLAVNVLLKAIIPHMPPEEALDITDYIVKSLQPLNMNRLLVTEQSLSIACQLFDAVPLSSKSAVLISELFAKVARGLEHSIRNQEIIELKLETHNQMLDELLQAMSRASTEVEEFSTVHTAEVMPPEDPFAEDYPDYGELNVQEVLNITNWLQSFTEMHKCLQLMGVVSAFLLLPGEAPILIKRKDLTSKTLVVETTDRASLSLSDLQTYVHIPPDFLDTFDEQEIAVQFTVFELNPIWWYPEQYKVRTAVLSLGAYWKDLSSLSSRSAQKQFTFTMALKDAKQADDFYLVKGHVNGSLDMPVYEKTLPPNAVLIVKFLPPEGPIRILLATGKRPRSYMLNQAIKVDADSQNERYFLVNHASKPSKAFVAVASENQISFTFTMSVRVCVTWNPTTLDWTSEYCSVDSETNATNIRCSCSHLSMFAAKVHPTFGLLQPSRSILAELTLNYSLIATYFLTVILLLGFLFVAWWRDLSASKEVVVLNTKPRQSPLYKYLVTIYTNGHARAATSSNVTIQIRGNLLDSPEFTLYGSTFLRNAQTSFIVHCPTYLGALQSVSLYHDSFGRSPSWNCHAVKVRDEAKEEDYLFIVDKWLSDHESKSCTASGRLITKEDLNSKGFIFRETLSNDFANWYSQQVLYPPRLYGNLSATEKTAIFLVRVCVVLVGTMIVFGPTTMFTYEEEREIYYYMLLDFAKLFPILFFCHLTGLVTAVALKYFFIKLRTQPEGGTPYRLVFDE